ncbi:MAG TPA: D-aminoacyl-tRNA deacylase [bacterium]|nr:D-aminoacyl-tRNA deacylase [bacterium]HPN31064.1 D-aminoacyl-tRNA deacylase [bacterium]
MKAVIQRVKNACVKIDGTVYSEINKGILVLAGFRKDDCIKDIEYLTDKIINLRIFEDSDGKMNLNINQINGEILIVPQFTLYGSCLRGNRPDFIEAADIETGNALFKNLKNYCLTKNDIVIKYGKYQAYMEVGLQNDGPVTFIIESADKIKR